MIPIFHYFLKNPDNSSKRYEQLSVLSSENPLYEISKNTVLTLGEFNIKGDCNQRHNYNCQPQLFWLVGIFFIVGMIYFFKYRRQVPFALLLFCFFLMLLPAIFTNEGIPHALRSIGSLVPAYIFSGFGAFLIFKLLSKKEDSWEATEKYQKYIKQLHRIRKELFLLAFLLLAFSGYVQYHTYFDSWRFSTQISNEFGQKYYNIATKMNALPKDTKKYVLVNTNGVWVDEVPAQAQTIKFFTRDDKNVSYLRSDELTSLVPEKGSIIIPLNQSVEIFREIKKNFPGGKVSISENIIFYEVQ